MYFLGAETVTAIGQSTIRFPMDMSSYGIQALAGQTHFRVNWTEPTISGWLTWFSDPVTLNFNVPPCNSIHNAGCSWTGST